MLFGEFVEGIYWQDRAKLRECTLVGYRSAWEAAHCAPVGGSGTHPISAGTWHNGGLLIPVTPV